MVAGDNAAAYVSRHAAIGGGVRMSIRPIGRGVIYDIYAQAKAMASPTATSRSGMGRAHQDAYAVEGRPWGLRVANFGRLCKSRLISSGPKNTHRQSGSGAAGLDVSVLRRRTGALVRWCRFAEDDSRRYTTDNEILIKTPDGTNISGELVSAKRSTPLPTLESPFTTRRTMPRSARPTAMPVLSPAPLPSVVPYQHDGDDARAVIDWIARILEALDGCLAIQSMTARASSPSC